jgi:hypothetical protein
MIRKKNPQSVVRIKRDILDLGREWIRIFDVKMDLWKKRRVERAAFNERCPSDHPADACDNEECRECLQLRIVEHDIREASMKISAVRNKMRNRFAFIDDCAALGITADSGPESVQPEVDPPRKKPADCPGQIIMFKEEQNEDAGAETQAKT